jgi:MOSC domain-containing protein YiiM
MKLVSVNVGLPREVTWKGKQVSTAIFKEPVQGRVLLRTLNLEGDRQADLSVHGGADKRSTSIQLSIMTTGGASCQVEISPGAASAKTSPPLASWKEPFTSAIGSASDQRKSS